MHRREIAYAERTISLSHALLWTDLPTVPYDNSGANVG